MRSLVPAIWIFLAFVFITSPVAAQSSRKSEVVVLSTLHTFHENSKYYSYDMLSRTIERLKPDVLAVELTAADLQSRKIQKVKQEYQHSIFPLADKRGYILVPLEPDPPKFGELVSLVQNSEKQLRDKYPQKAEAFSVYSDALYEYLFRSWKSVLDVNSSETDALFEASTSFRTSCTDPTKSSAGTAGMSSSSRKRSRRRPSIRGNASLSSSVSSTPIGSGNICARLRI